MRKRRLEDFQLNAFVERVTGQDAPMIEDAETERLTRSIGSQIGFESEGVYCRDVCHDCIERRARLGGFSDDVTSASNEHLNKERC